MAKVNQKVPLSRGGGGDSKNGVSAAPESPQLRSVLDKLTSLPEQVEASTLFTSKVDDASIAAAQDFIKLLYLLIQRQGLEWRAPHVSFDENSHAVELGWWSTKQVLQIWVTNKNHITYLRSWGPHIWNEMEEGENPSAETLTDIWKWLFA